MLNPPRKSHATRLALSALSLALAACAASMHKPEQGIQGTFTQYGPTRDTTHCEPLKTQPERDECRRANARVVEEPFRATIRIRNLQTREVKDVELDAQGSFRARLDPGEYEICVEGECSDPLTVRMGAWIPYGQRLPRPADPAPGKPAAAPAPKKP